MTPAPVVVERPCIGCLDTRRCWVCEGSGRQLLAAGSVACSACVGRGLCRLCRPVPQQRAGSAAAHG